MKPLRDFTPIVIMTSHCPICFTDKPISESVISQCGHLFCWNCIYEWINRHAPPITYNHTLNNSPPSTTNDVNSNGSRNYNSSSSSNTNSKELQLLEENKKKINKTSKISYNCPICKLDLVGIGNRGIIPIFPVCYEKQQMQNTNSKNGGVISNSGSFNFDDNMEKKKKKKLIPSGFMNFIRSSSSSIKKKTNNNIDSQQSNNNESHIPQYSLLISHHQHHLRLPSPPITKPTSNNTNNQSLYYDPLDINANSTTIAYNPFSRAAIAVLGFTEDEERSLSHFLLFVGSCVVLALLVY